VDAVPVTARGTGFHRPEKSVTADLIALALENNAHALVTRDKHFEAVAVSDLRILSPGVFLRAPTVEPNPGGAGRRWARRSVLGPSGFIRARHTAVASLVDSAARGRQGWLQWYEQMVDQAHANEGPATRGREVGE
jgi:hypothetical protein